MAYFRCDFKSEALDMNTSMVVLIPDEIEDVKSAKVVYLLHGLSDNCTGWTRYTSVERYARAYGVVVVMPEVQRSFYTDMKYGIKYFTFIHEELPRICNKFFCLSTSPKESYIMGLSMGGYGTLKCVLNSPKRYAGAAAFSAVTDIRKWFVRAETYGYENEPEALFGYALEVPIEADLFAIVKQVESSDLPKLYMACGKDDELLSDSEEMVKVLETKNADFIYETWEGIHDWKFWDDAIRRAFKCFFEVN